MDCITSLKYKVAIPVATIGTINTTHQVQLDIFFDRSAHGSSTFPEDTGNLTLATTYSIPLEEHMLLGVHIYTNGLATCKLKSKRRDQRLKTLLD